MRDFLRRWRASMARELELNEPLAVGKPCRLFEDGDAAAVVLDQVVVRGKDVGDAALDGERGERNLQGPNDGNVNVRYGCACGRTEQAMLLFRGQQVVSQICRIRDFWIGTQQNRTLTKANLLPFSYQGDIPCRSLPRIYQVTSLWFCSFVPQFINGTRHPMHFVKNKASIPYVGGSDQRIPSPFVWRSRMRAISNEDTSVFKSHALLFHHRPRDAGHWTCGRTEPGPSGGGRWQTGGRAAVGGALRPSTFPPPFSAGWAARRREPRDGACVPRPAFSTPGSGDRRLTSRLPPGRCRGGCRCIRGSRCSPRRAGRRCGPCGR